MYDIAPNVAGLPEAASQAPPPGVKQAVNDFGQARYDGPQPPKDHGRHRYHFRLAALDVPRLDVPTVARVEDVWNAARPHVLAQAELIGLYER
jgi:Raf kinase inhibitor-like YbhB/YbcL family protein